MNRIQMMRLGIRSGLSPGLTLITKPQLAGVALEGATMTIVLGVYAGIVADRTYKIYRGATLVAQPTDLTYLVAYADAGSTLRVLEHAIGGADTLDTYSDPTATVLPLPPSEITAPVIFGVADVGAVLTATSAVFNHAATIAHRWTRDGADISAATGLTYTTVIADEGAVIRFYDVATNAGGDSAASVSNAIGPIPPAPAVPTITVSNQDDPAAAWTLATIAALAITNPPTGGYTVEVVDGSGNPVAGFAVTPET